MFLRDLVSTSFKSLFRRKLRSILTILGVVIGTIAVVLMLSIGYGLEATYTNQLEQMGSLTLIDVHIPYNGGGLYAREASISVTSKTDSENKVMDATAVKEMEQIENVEAVIPMLQTYIKFAAGRSMTQASLTGINPDHMQYLGIEVGEGELLSNDSTYDIVFGNEVLYQFRKPGSNGNMYNDYYYYEEDQERQPPDVDIFNVPLIMTYNMQFGEPNPYGDSPAINYRNYKVNAVGVLGGKQYSEYSYQAFMNIEQLEKVIKEYEKASNQKILENGYSTVKIKVNDIKNVEKVQEDLKLIGYDSYSLTDQLDSMNEMTKMIQLVLGGIAGVAFLIAAIGIANTMVMSIYERTKEIGVMKVLGCGVNTIRQMFLFEAALIGLTGGLFGTGISILLSKLANKVVGGSDLLGLGMNDGMILSLITPELAIGAIMFSTIIGIVFGLYPAVRATKISPLEAIRHD